MIKLNNQVKYARTRRFNCSLTNEQEQLHTQNLFCQQDLFNFTNRYLEKTYGLKHMDRPFPDTRVQRRYLVSQTIIPKYMKERFEKEKWSKKLTGLYSTAAYMFLETMLINFGEYRKALKDFAKASEQEKQDYKNNVYQNNRQHKSWYRKGSLNYIYQSNANLHLRTVSFDYVYADPIRIVSPHYVYVPSYGKIFVKQNLRNFQHLKLKIVRIKRRRDHDYEIQLGFLDNLKRKSLKKIVGVDWNMYHNQVWRTSNSGDQPFVIPDLVLNQANQLEDQINQQKELRDHWKTFLADDCQRIQKLASHIRYLYQKRSHILTNWYYQLAHQVIDPLDGIALEKLSVRDMYSEVDSWSEASNHGKNRKLALIKPYELSMIAKQVCDRQGKTWLAVDAYHTSQVEFGTHYLEKHSTDEREWVSKYTGKKIIRDLNAARNILDWALNPNHHAKVWEGKVTEQWQINNLVKLNNQ